MNYKDQKNIAGETENLSSDEQNVARLLSDLKRVDAPKAFDFHLKARIANASPGDYRPVRFFPVFRYALPLALFLVAGGAFVLNSSYSGGGNVPIVADSSNVRNPTPADTSINVIPKELDSASVPVIEDIVAGVEPKVNKRPFAQDANKATRRSPVNRPGYIDFPGGGSYDIGGGSSNAKARRPQFGNTNGNSNSPGNPGGIARRPLELRQVLRSIGIEADFEEKGWRVRLLTKNGVAERSGLRTGDLMEAIDDKPITTLYDGSFSAKSISVRRDDKVQKIDIKANP